MAEGSPVLRVVALFVIAPIGAAVVVSALLLDAVAVYRPSEEIPGIIAAQVLPLGARILWLQPPVSSSDARRIAADRGLRFVEGVDLAATARQLSGR